MSTGRYYFSEIKENDPLGYVAQLSKQILQEGEKIVEIFQKQYKILHAKSPGKIYLLMEQNSQSIFNLSPNTLAKSNQPKSPPFRIGKSSEDLSTPVKRNENLNRKFCSVGDYTEKASNSAVSEIETVNVSGRRIFSTKNTDGIIVKPNIDDTDIVDEVFVGPTTSKSPQMIGNSDARNKEFHSPNSNTDETATVEQKYVSPNASKLVGNRDASNQESPRSAQTTKMLAGLNVDDCESSIPLKDNIIANEFPARAQNPDKSRQIVENFEANQDSDELFGENLNILNRATDEKHTPSPVKRAKGTCNNLTESLTQGFLGSVEQVGMPINLDSKLTAVPLRGNKINISPIERTKTIEISEVKRKSPSPRRNNALFRAMPKIICSDRSDEWDIEFLCESAENFSPTTAAVKNDIGDDNSAVENIRSDVLGQSKSEKSPKILLHKLSPSGKKSPVCSPQNVTETNRPTEDTGLVLRKKISPLTRPSKGKISPKDIGLQMGPSGKTTSVRSTEFENSDCPETQKDYVSRNSKSPSTTIPLKISVGQFSPSDKKSRINSSESVMEVNSPCKTKEYFSRQISPTVCLLKAKKSVEGSCDSNQILKQIDNSDSNVLHWFINKLTKLITVRDDCMENIFESFLEFQKELNLIFLYVKKIAYVIEKILTDGQVSITEEFKSITVDLTAMADKLVEQLNLWKIAGNSEVQSWIRCFEEIKNMKSHHETYNNAGASPVQFMRILRVYEQDLKSVWKKMDDMKILEDARRSSLLNLAQNFEKLIKLFIKCLIIIGVLNHHTKTS